MYGCIPMTICTRTLVAACESAVRPLIGYPNNCKYQRIGRFRIRNRRGAQPRFPFDGSHCRRSERRELALVVRTPDTEGWSAREELAGCGLVSSQTADRWRKVEDIPIARTELILATARCARRHL